MAVFDQLITFHKSYLGLLDLHARLTERDLSPHYARKELSQVIEELVKLRENIFSDWRTADDLANILVEKFSLPAEKLKELAAKYPPPQSWYEETTDPFSAD
ncbi:MAG: hypothetical protein L0241_14015 [Planctomycetia bacterium]|nr:hypothetical protein [Planctomycetia bacterium]